MPILWSVQVKEIIKSKQIKNLTKVKKSNVKKKSRKTEKKISLPYNVYREMPHSSSRQPLLYKTLNVPSDHKIGIVPN